ncbi:hypothetical protein LVJ94_18265 [Pendulispora rubella]|uniref:Dihydrolipoamide acetyltransferase n=1 Tax=Pendulispora rubella TaxID=2741070 RepID=A0ABZ2LEH2_9BACT
MGLTFLLSVAVSFSVIAQQPTATKGDGKAGTAKDGGATSTASPAGQAAATGGAAAGAAKDGGAPVGATGTATGSASGQMDGQTYAVRLRDLEARVDELKDQIGRSHRRLALLSDTIMTQGAGGSRSEITFHNEMSSAFKLTRALVTLDGAVQYNRQDETGALADQKDVPIFSGSVPAGDHTISVVLNFQGNGYGVFTYLRGYKFEVKSSHSFTAVEGKTMTVDATALEKGGVTTPLEQRPTIEWHEKVQSLGAQPVPAGAAPGGATAPAAAPAPAGSASGSVGVSVGGGKK